MYGSQQNLYPTQQPPYPTQQPPYPTQQPPYPTGQAPLQQPPYCVPPSYDEAVSGKFQAPQPSYQAPPAPYQGSNRAPYQGFPPEHTITVCSLHQNSLQPCDCCPHNPPPQQYPIVIQQDVATHTQNTHQCIKCFFIIIVITFFCIFFGVIIKSALNFNYEFNSRL
uniref:Roquin n=2 Tax=Lygus hesperus TaxID=30085 RepID=A0A0A9YGP6_LYGHE